MNLAGRIRGRAAAFVWLAALLLALAAGTALAQDEPDYVGWNIVAQRGEALIEAGDASTEGLQSLRAETVRWRDQFQAAESLNAPRISAVKEQIAALGPVPKDGAAEDPDIAARRKQLEQQLAELQAPGLRAVEAYSRADNMIKAIDGQVRGRQARSLLRLTPSPLLPSSWIAALDEGTRFVGGVWEDVNDRTYGAAGQALVGRLPLIGLYVALAIGLLVFARRVDVMPARLTARASEYARDAMVFAASLAQIVIPVGGAYLLIAALDTSGLAGSWARPVLMALPVAALILFAGRWLGRRFFPLHSDPPICYPEPQRIRGRFVMTALAAATGVHHVLARAMLPLSGLGTDGPPA